MMRATIWQTPWAGLALALAAALVVGCGGGSPAGSKPSAAPGASGAASGPAGGSPGVNAPGAQTPAPPGPPKDLTVGLVSKTFTQLAHWAAETQGYYTAEGLNLEPVY